MRISWHSPPEPLISPILGRAKIQGYAAGTPMLNDQPLPQGFPSLEGAGQRARAIVATLLYYDLFAFPPNADELVRFAHRGGKDGRYGADDLVAESPWWSSCDGYWFLKGRDYLTVRRAEFVPITERKMAQARRWARLLQVIPGVRFVGITGSLSMASAVAEDDIDILVITAAGRLWLTRVLVLAALWAGRVKRADDDRAAHPDQICANIFLSEDDLHLPDHNLFIAHEICQMLPLLGPATYQRFIAANAWVGEFLPQWEPPTVKWEDRRILRGLQRVLETASASPLGGRLEHECARRQLNRIQYKHARGHNVGVKLSSTQLRFHPRDLSDYVVGTFNSRWNALNAEQGGVPVQSQAVYANVAGVLG